jgi:hypothetical protein
MGDDDIRRQLAYYKRHLDELAAERIAIEHHQWALHMQLRQKKQAFQLLSRLAPCWPSIRRSKWTER